MNATDNRHRTVEAGRTRVLPAQRSAQHQRTAAQSPLLPPQQRHDAAGTTVLLLDPSRETREMLSSGLLGNDIGTVIVADTVPGAEDVINSGTKGQLALVSLAFGDQAGRLIQLLRAAGWHRVIALAPNAESGPAVAALQAGACGILRGNPTLPPSDLPPLVHELSDREIEVLSGVADGRSNKWIGEHLSLSSLTVKSHLARISRKLGTGDRAHMVAIAMRAGLVP